MEDGSDIFAQISAFKGQKWQNRGRGDFVSSYGQLAESEITGLWSVFIIYFSVMYQSLQACFFFLFNALVFPEFNELHLKFANPYSDK